MLRIGHMYRPIGGVQPATGRAEMLTIAIVYTICAAIVGACFASAGEAR